MLARLELAAPDKICAFGVPSPVTIVVCLLSVFLIYSAADNMHCGRFGSAEEVEGRMHATASLCTYMPLGMLE